MTPQEQQMLQGLTDRINQTALPAKDPEAENYLQDTLGRNPDALYILAQTILVQQYALDQANKRLAEARNDQAPPAPQKHTSFLGNLLGLNDPPPQSQGQYVPGSELSATSSAAVWESVRRSAVWSASIQHAAIRLASVRSAAATGWFPPFCHADRGRCRCWSTGV